MAVLPSLALCLLLSVASALSPRYPTPHQCAFQGKRCMPGKLPCCAGTCKPFLWFPVGVCQASPASCATVTGECRTRTPSYTGPELPCCDKNLRCVDRKCVPPASPTPPPTCLASGKACTPGSGSCCGSLGCLQVIMGAPPSEVGVRHVCFNKNCGRSPCSASQPCCPGYSCSRGQCLAPPAPPPPPPTCIASGQTCTNGGSPCCKSLRCQIVVTGAAPPIGLERRICFDENCGLGECSASKPCCPGAGCGSNGQCVFPPSAPPPGGGLGPPVSN